MKTKDVDYKYSLDLFERINSIEVDGKTISNFYFYSGYNIWAMFRQQIFQEIKLFSGNKQYNPTPKKNIAIWIVDNIFNLIIFLVGSISLVIFQFRKKDALVYAVDLVNSKWKSDFRLETLYHFLTMENISFSEIFHTIPGRETIEKMLKRRRFSMYLEILDWFYEWASNLGIRKHTDMLVVDNLELSNIEESEKEFVRKILSKYIKQVDRSIYKIEKLKKLLKKLDPKILFAIDDARSYNELILASSLLGIVSYSIQHGHFTKYHVGWIKEEGVEGKIPSPSYILVWSDFWKKELIRLKSIFDSDQIIVAGVKDVFSHREMPTSKEGSISVMIPYETVCPKAEVSLYIRKILECNDVKIIFKLRPDIKESLQLEEYGLENEKSSNFEAKLSLDYDDTVDVVAGTYSTFLYDMIAADKPVVILNTSTDYGEGLIVHKLAEKLELDENICENLKNQSKLSSSERIRRKELLYGKEPILLQDTLRKIVREHNI